MLWQYFLNSFLFRDEAILDEIHGNLNGSLATALAIASLEHVELALLDGEFDVLHVSVVLFENVCVGLELRIHIGHDIFQLRYWLGRTNTSDNIFALGIDQKLAKKRVLAIVGITCEADSGTRGVTHVSKHHGLHIHRSPQQIPNILHLPVLNGPISHPSTKHRPNRQLELLVRILRKAQIILGIHPLESLHHLLEIIGRQVGILINALLVLDIVDLLFELRTRELEHDIAKHFEKSPIGIPRESLVAALGGQSRADLVVHSQIEHRVHHSGHADRRAGSYAEQ
mmetsp:Transcript_13816/g.29419  ORF Transcript_13816/g.29419 Transcript_13816/m.29419 type:complete len:284 (+) Transcript_13816:222-1073(+)